MAIFEFNEVAGIIVKRGTGKEILCKDCASDEDWDNALQDDIITYDQANEDLYFCDQCKKRL